MAQPLERSLRMLLAREQLGDYTDRMNWMVLTWDLARVAPDESINRYVRVFLAAAEVLVVDGDRSASRFHRTNPQLGAPRDSMATLDTPLPYAHSTTALALEQGYRMVCSPLAVDCSDLKDRRFPDHSYLGHHDSLPSAMTDDCLAGTTLLRTINTARWEAMLTHCAGGWDDLYPASVPQARRLLWAGKYPPEPRLGR